MAPSRAILRLVRPANHRLRPVLVAAPPKSRFYHSYDHPPPPGRFNAAESAILSAAYARVPEHGFTVRALTLGARDAGYPDISTNVVPDGAFSLILYHLVTQREALAPRSREIFAAAAEAERPMQVGDKIERLAWERLLGNRDVIHRWQEALAQMAQPSRVPASLHELALLADEIVFLSGDNAADPTWYARRASVASAYAAAELFMSADGSAGFGATREFLDRRLDESTKLGNAVSSVGQWIGFTASAGVNVLRSKGMRI
ncbi:ubiquinone biosynthesis protein COQ9 [Xylariomycetidae sp. FL0641]|nr:ubiquinone biosynthesis protein COQ9 [Xylariomycetidae sp. FL0641]